MKYLKDAICEAQLNEAREYTYRVALDAIKDKDGLPITITIAVDGKFHSRFEEWLESQLGNEFSHACGANNDWESDF